MLIKQKSFSLFLFEESEAEVHDTHETHEVQITKHYIFFSIFGFREKKHSKNKIEIIFKLFGQKM